MTDPNAPKNYYDPYLPSVPAAVIAIIVFIILLALHLWRIAVTRTWFCIPLIVGAIFEVVGYFIRVNGHYHPDVQGTFIIQYVLILCAPILFAASAYMFLGRIILATGQASYSMIRPSFLTKIFVGGDILCFLIQAGGGGILAGADTKSRLDLGKNIILVGLVLQIIIFGFFVAVGVVFHIRMRKNPGSKTMQGFAWEALLTSLYGVSGVITVRNIFRVIEYVGGRDGYLMTHEWPMYVFDAFLMALVLGGCLKWYIGRIITGQGEAILLGDA